MRRIFNLLSWIFVYGLAIYWGASYFTEQDGTWHMTVIRDTDFTPSHIIEFYMAYPIYIIMGIGSFMYARTRLPTFACKGWSVAFVMLFVGPFMIFPNVELNEWGHTFWFMEELFVAPLHWGFVFFGWSRSQSLEFRCRSLAVLPSSTKATKISSVSNRLNEKRWRNRSLLGSASDRPPTKLYSSPL